MTQKMLICRQNFPIFCPKIQILSFDYFCCTKFLLHKTEKLNGNTFLKTLLLLSDVLWLSKFTLSNFDTNTLVLYLCKVYALYLYPRPNTCLSVLQFDSQLCSERFFLFKCLSLSLSLALNKNSLFMFIF